MAKKKEKLVWHNEKRKVNELIPLEGNPRQMTKIQAADLQKSLERFNLMSIPVINTDNTIVSGHQRLKILQLLGRGKETIDVRYPNRKLTLKEVQEAALRENKNVGSFDFDILANNFDTDFLKDVGFTDFDLGLGEEERELGEGKGKECYEIIVECANKKAQKTAFMRLNDDGYKCHIKE